MRKLNGYIPSQPDSRDYKLEMYDISNEFSATCTEIRPVFEEIGDVEWDKETNTVIIKV